MIKQLRNRLRKAKCHAVFADFYGTVKQFEMQQRIVKTTTRKLRSLGVRA